MKDEPVLMYVKDDVLYPLALNMEQKQTFDILMHLIPGEMHYIKDRPVGKVMEVNADVRDGESFEAENR